MAFPPLPLHGTKEENIELKFEVSEERFIECRKIAMSLDPTSTSSLWQFDTFFNIPTKDSYLKMRAENCVGNDMPNYTLIFYRRPKDVNAKQSSFVRYFPKSGSYEDSKSDPEQLVTILSLSLGVLGIVQKLRTVYHVNNVRIHLDVVGHSDTYVEMEYCVSNEYPAEKGKETLENLVKVLKLADCKRIDGAYMDRILANEKTKK
jgi:adenylate cyclase class IV